MQYLLSVLIHVGTVAFVSAMNSIPQKTKETTGDLSSASAQAVDIALLEPPVEFKRFPAKVLPKALKKLLQWVKRNYPRAGKPPIHPNCCQRHLGNDI